MSPRYSTVRSQEVEYAFWLIFEETGGLRLTRAEPSLDRAERAMACRVTLPRSLWRTPSLSATITVADGGGPVVNLNIDALREAVRQSVGVDIDFRVEPPPVAS